MMNGEAPDTVPNPEWLCPMTFPWSSANAGGRKPPSVAARVAANIGNQAGNHSHNGTDLPGYLAVSAEFLVWVYEWDTQ